MKILFLTTGVSSVGGISKYNRVLLKVLRELENDVLMIDRNGLSKINFIFQSFFQVLKQKPDLIICSHLNFSPLCFLFQTVFGKNYIVIVYGTEVWDIKQKWKRIGLTNAKAIISISHYTKNRILEQMPEVKEKICILSPSINGREFYPKPKPQYLLDKFSLDNKKIILTVARLEKSEGHKGYDKIIKALPKVIKEIPNLKYLLVGEGSDLPRMKELVKNLRLEDYVVFCGFIPDNDLIDYYNLCDVFVMPSKQEGFGIVYIEVLACGKPVIAGTEDASGGTLLRGELGILVDPDNIDEIAKAIIKVLKKEVPDRILDSQYLRKRVIEIYGLDKFKEEVKILFK